MFQIMAAPFRLRNIEVAADWAIGRIKFVYDDDQGSML